MDTFIVLIGMFVQVLIPTVVIGVALAVFLRLPVGRRPHHRGERFAYKLLFGGRLPEVPGFHHRSPRPIRAQGSGTQS